jgi:hypothetical protein
VATRREILMQAALGALALATPASLAALAQQLANDRYLIVELSDGRLLAVDLEDRRRAYLLTPEPLADGEHALAESGSVTVRGGRIAGIGGSPRTRFYELSSEGESLAIRRRDRPDLPVQRVPISGTAPQRRG